MPILRKSVQTALAAGGLATAAIAEGPSAPAPTLTYIFSVKALLALPVEQGEIDGKRKRFIAITGGSVYGPNLQGEVLPGGGDWQAIGADGRTEVYARYSLKASDGTIISVINPGYRTGPKDVIARLTKGEDVDPSLYYFRTTPSFEVRAGPHDWLRGKVFVARGIRKPDHVVIDYYQVN
jgi:Protein of unknown function (DUF3237)